MGNNWDILWLAVLDWMDGRGLKSKAAGFILYAMAAEVITYEEARDIYAEWLGDAPERVHASVCYDILRSGAEIPPAKYLQELLEELKEDEDGVYAAEGS